MPLPPQDPPTLSVLVVSYRTLGLTLECLRSLHAQTTEVSFETLVVDNASDDGSAEAIAAEFPQARLFALERNVGFAAANNLAAEHARGELFLLLNPDTVVLEHAVDRIVEVARRRPEAGIWGGRTVFADGRLNRGSCWAAPTLWSTFLIATGLANKVPALHPEAMGTWRRDSEREVDIVSGCFLLTSAQLWRRLGGFDPAFFMYGEDADLCLRARALGARPMISPSATLVHHGGASERIRSDKLVRLFRAKAQLCARYWGPLRGRVGVAQLDLWAWLRVVSLSLAGLFRPRFREGAREWCSVLRQRCEWWDAYREQARAEAGTRAGKP